MKKIMFLFLAISSFAYSQIGLSLGYDIGELNQLDLKTNVKSFGILWDLKISDNLDLQPSLNYAFTESAEWKSRNSFNDQNYSKQFISIGLNLKYYLLGRSKSLFLYPSISYANVPQATRETFPNYNLSKKSLIGGIGFGFNISDSITLIGIYSIQNYGGKYNPKKVKGNAFGLKLQIKP